MKSLSVAIQVKATEQYFPKSSQFGGRHATLPPPPPVGGYAFLTRLLDYSFSSWEHSTLASMEIKSWNCLRFIFTF